MHEKFHYKSLEEIRQRAAELGEWLPLEEDVSILTSPMRLGDWTLPNRIALQPMEGTDGTPLPPLCQGRRGAHLV